MKRILIIILCSIFLVGCGGSISENFNFDAEIDSVKQYTIEFATGGGDIEEFREFIEEFNDKLSEVKSDDSDINKFVELQREANELRLVGFEEDDFDKINESTALQAQALEIYYELKDAN